MLFQPHAGFIVTGHKAIETRDWAPGPESGSPDGWTGTLAIVSAPNSRTHDLWMLDSFQNETVMEIEAQLRRSDPEIRHGRQGKTPMSSGCLIGLVDLVSVERLVRIEPFSIVVERLDEKEPNERRLPMIVKPECELGIYEPGRYMWHLENPRRLPELIPLVGQRRLFDLPSDVEQRLIDWGLVDVRREVWTI